MTNQTLPNQRNFQSYIHTVEFGRAIGVTGSTESFHNKNNDGVFNIEVKGSGAFVIEVEGCVGITNEAWNAQIPDSECNWTTLSVVNLNDFSISKQIKADGIYQLAVTGLARIRVNVKSISGTVSVIGGLGE